MILDYVYLILKEKLKATLNDVELIEWDTAKDNRRGQLTCDSNLFIGFSPFEVSVQMLRNIQQCEVIAELRLVTKEVAEGDKKIRNNATGHLAIAREVYIQAQRIDSGWLSDIPEFASLKGTVDDFKIINDVTRTGGSTDHSGSSIMRTPQEFKIVFFDPMACPAFQKATANIEINHLLM